MSNPNIMTEHYCVIRLGLIAMHNGMWYTPQEAWRAWKSILYWYTETGAQRFVDMNGGEVKHVSEVFDASVILALTETRRWEHDRRSIEETGIDPHGVGSDGGPGDGPYRDPVQPQVGPSVRAQEPAVWLVVIWLVVMVLLAVTAEYGVLP